jgi:hypothetical protein
MNAPRGAAGGRHPEAERDGKELPPPATPSIADQVFGFLLIERAVTDDAPDGQPWPPTTLMDRWVLVRSLPGHRTLWRRITLSETA